MGGSVTRSGRETDLRRMPPSREQRLTVLIATNGRNTERDYFTAVKELPWVRVGRVAVVFTNGSPLDVVRDAGRRKAENEFDHAWVVCDVDRFRTAEAEKQAPLAGVEIAWSNPCFELWLLLHRCEHTAYLEDAVKACRKLGKALSRVWDKADFNFSDFAAGIDQGSYSPGTRV